MKINAFAFLISSLTTNHVVMLIVTAYHRNADRHILTADVKFCYAKVEQKYTPRKFIFIQSAWLTFNFWTYQRILVSFQFDKNHSWKTKFDFVENLYHLMTVFSDFSFDSVDQFSAMRIFQILSTKLPHDFVTIGVNLPTEKTSKSLK